MQIDNETLLAQYIQAINAEKNLRAGLILLRQKEREQKAAQTDALRKQVNQMRATILRRMETK